MDLCGDCPGRTQPTLLKRPPLCIMSKIVSKNILLHQLFWEGACRCFWFAVPCNIFAFFVHSTFHMSTYGTRSPQQFLCTGIVLEHQKTAQFPNYAIYLNVKNYFVKTGKWFKTSTVEKLMEERKFGSATNHGWGSTTSPENSL